MNNKIQERKEETEVLVDARLDPTIPVQEIDKLGFQIPECCREGWPNCPHVVQKQRKAKRNIGL